MKAIFVMRNENVMNCVSINSKRKAMLCKIFESELCINMQ